MSPRAAWRLEALGFLSVFEYAAGLADWAAAGLPVEGEVNEVPTIGHIARKDVPRAHLEELLGDVSSEAEKQGWDTAIVVNDASVVLGRLFRSDLSSSPHKRVASVMDPGPSTFRPNVSVIEMHRYMVENDLSTAPVTTSEGVLVGIVLREDLDRVISQLREARPEGR